MNITLSGATGRAGPVCLAHLGHDVSTLPCIKSVPGQGIIADIPSYGDSEA
jgi:hypothetical protein